jgi:hypothetical protein
LICEVADYGALGEIKEIEWSKLYDFYLYLAFERQKNDRE